MILGYCITRRKVEAKFGTGKSFDKSYFLHLCEIYMRNDKRLFNMVATHRPLDTARAIIKFVVEQSAFDQESDEYETASVRGIISGMGGHIYHRPVLGAVVRMVEKERDRREEKEHCNGIRD